MFGQSQAELSYVFTNPVFQNFGMKNGLTSNYCYDVIQDKKGYIWVATLNGLVRFNGNNWLSFQQQNKNLKYQIPANWVIDIDQDEQNNIWINTDRGIAKYSQQEDSIISFNEPVKGWGKIQCLRRNELLVTSWNGVSHLKNEHNKLVTLFEYQQSARNSLPHIFKDEEGNCWTCPEDNPSLIKINPNKKSLTYYKTINIDNIEKSIVINSISKFTTDTILLATNSHGLLKYCIRNNRAFSFHNQLLLASYEYTCASVYCFNNRKYLFIGTKKNGLLIMDLSTQIITKNIYNNNNPNSISSNFITSLCIDNNQGVWIGTNMGLSYFHPSLQKNKYHYFYNNAVFPEGTLINSVCQTKNNQYLIGTDNGGLYLYNNISQQIEKIKFNSKLITSITKFNNNELIVTSNTGTYIYSIKFKKCNPFIIANKPFKYSTLNAKIFSDNSIALCTYNGIMLFNFKQKSIIYSDINNQKTNENKICKDALLLNGKLWIVRFFNSFDIYDLKTKKNTQQIVPELANKPVDYHNITSNQTSVFIATSVGIIQQNISNLKFIKLLKTSNGLMGDEIENVCSINNTYLYYTTPDGLYNYNTLKQESSLINSYENYAQKFHNQLAFLNNESIVYTVSNYFIVNIPFLNLRNKKTPTLFVEKYWVNGKELKNNNDTLLLTYQENNIDIKFAALVYPNSLKNSWYYQLNTNDSEYLLATNNEISLNNLLPNTYCLKVYSCNNEGVKSSTFKTIVITVLQPFYKRWWFYFLLALLLICFLYLIIKYKAKQQFRLTQIRNQISRDLHDELGANVSSINIMANMLLNKNKDQSDQVLVNISKYSVQISDTINDIIWNVNPKFDSISELIKRMTRYASETLEASSINYTINLPQTQVNINIHNQIKYHLYLIFKEAINNASKYSKATNVSINLAYNTKYFQFIIKDNGIGFDENAKENGNGLSNMKTRASEIGAQLNITSEKNLGVEIEISIKL